jgi:hypothetical protein
VKQKKLVWFFKTINKVDKPLANLTRRRENTQINKLELNMGMSHKDMKSEGL